jgi:hypothetical protein
VLNLAEHTGNYHCALNEQREHRMSITAPFSINSQALNSKQQSEAAITKFSTINNSNASVHSTMRSGCFLNLE